jgi:hypothetical protein
VSQSVGVIRVIGRCSVASCPRAAVRFVEFATDRYGTLAGSVCEHCAEATSSALFLLDLIA